MELTATLEELRFGLQPDEMFDGSVHLRFIDAGPDSQRSLLSVDWLALTDVNHPPVADAGDDHQAPPGHLVVLDGSLSSDPDGDPLGFSWVQLSGPPAELFTDADSSHPSLHTPEVTETTSLQFELTVTDGFLSSSDTTTITVVPRDELPACALRVTTGPAMPAAADHAPGTDDVECMQLRLDSVGRNTVRVTSLQFDLETQGFADSVRGAALALDLDSDGVADDDEPVLKRLSQESQGPLVFNSLELDVPAGESADILLLLDLPGPDQPVITTAGQAGFPLSLWPLVPVLMAVFLAFSGRRRRLAASIVLVAALCACLREGYRPWNTYVRAGLLSREAVVAHSVDDVFEAVVAGPPVIGNWQQATTRVLPP
jgi:hypothetical protein